MALTKGLEVQGVTPTTVEAGDFVAFSNGTFGEPVVATEFNGGTHVRSSVGADDSTANTPNNVKYVASGTADWGDGTESLDLITDAEATLKITLTESVSITVTGITMYGFDGTTPATAPVGMDVYLAEVGDTTWTNADGSGSALSLSDSSTPATDHYFYVAISASPSSVGTKDTNKTRFAFTYQ